MNRSKTHLPNIPYALLIVASLFWAICGCSNLFTYQPSKPFRKPSEHSIDYIPKVMDCGIASLFILMRRHNPKVDYQSVLDAWRLHNADRNTHTLVAVAKKMGFRAVLFKGTVRILNALLSVGKAVIVFSRGHAFVVMSKEIRGYSIVDDMVEKRSISLRYLAQFWRTSGYSALVIHPKNRNTGSLR